jgi:hypothetical protein
VLTLLAAALVARLELRRAWAVTLIAVAVSIPFSSWDRTVPRSTFSAPEPVRPAPGTALPDPHTAWEAGSGGWYWRHENLVELCLVPLGMPAFFFDDFRGNPTSVLDRIRYRPVLLQEEPSTIVRVVEWGQLHREVEIDTARGGTLLWRVIWFPEMEVTIDGRGVESSPDVVTGLLSHRVPAGAHRVGWRWRPFPALAAARLASLIAALAVAGLAFAAWVGRRRSDGY